MDLLVPAWDNRLGQLNNAQLMEFERAIEKTFMPYIRTHMETFDNRGSFLSLPGLGIPDINDSVQGEDGSSQTDTDKPPLEGPGSPQTSTSAEMVAFDGDAVSSDLHDGMAPLSLLDEPPRHEKSLGITSKTPFEDSTGDMFPATASEMSIDPN